jgi:hypothetical protein
VFEVCLVSHLLKLVREFLRIGREADAMPRRMNKGSKSKSQPVCTLAIYGEYD